MIAENVLQKIPLFTISGLFSYTFW